MSTKTAVSIGLLVGSILGGYIPSLWGAGFLSFWGIITCALGGLLGIYIGFRFTEQ